MKYTPDVIDGWLQQIADDLNEPLTDWEESFVESVADQWERRRWLSDRQLEILERIYAEKTP